MGDPPSLRNLSALDRPHRLLTRPIGFRRLALEQHPAGRGGNARNHSAAGTVVAGFHRRAVFGRQRKRAARSAQLMDNGLMVSPTSVAQWSVRCSPCGRRLVLAQRRQQWSAFCSARAGALDHRIAQGARPAWATEWRQCSVRIAGTSLAGNGASWQARGVSLGLVPEWSPVPGGRAWNDGQPHFAPDAPSSPRTARASCSSRLALSPRPASFAGCSACSFGRWLPALSTPATRAISRNHRLCVVTRGHGSVPEFITIMVRALSVSRSSPQDPSRSEPVPRCPSASGSSSVPTRLIHCGNRADDVRPASVAFS